MAGYGTSESYASEIELFISLAGDSDAGILEAFLNPMNAAAAIPPMAPAIAADLGPEAAL
ncbi:hypothetical protein SDJN02_07493 [Cucurbita argyrosperma subsp. argyrosperma]|nr:hypothetical protein SDJN02_07493 [Cucurbita argyrosperma subsp. argyrosperma]